MYITKIIIDGFKSYAQRTEISGWDTNFNAITGLNGSGKSNILDAICFVLGIKQLSKIRVGKLSELVYKQGQGGITKASVSIEFDNSDKSNSPVGQEIYDEITVTRQVVIEGQTKYLVNGHTQKAKQVHNLFHSVQLNINNPHFVIMQGRITKVLNMKPPEILGMLEEAAGTRMYQEKKKDAEKTISKKQAKLVEIDMILTEKITPQRDRLQKENKDFEQWERNGVQIKRLSRFTIAHKYVRCFGLLQKSEEVRKEQYRELSEAQAEEKTLQEKVTTLERERETILEKRDSEMVEEGKQLEDEKNKASKEVVKLNVIKENTLKSLKSEKKTLVNVIKSETKVQSKLIEKSNEFKENKGECVAMEDEHNKLQETLKTLQSQQLGMSVSDSQSNRGTLAQQLMDAQREKVEAESADRQFQDKCKHLTSEIKKTNREMNTAKKDHGRQQKTYDQKTKQLQKCEADLKNQDVDLDEVKGLEGKMQVQDEELEESNNRIRELQHKLRGIKISYRDPVPNFDRSKVHGIVARLFSVKDKRYATALQAVAGSHLYSVIVDRVATAKLLFRPGILRNRISVMPLDNMKPKRIEPGRIRAARKIVGADNIIFPLDSIEYDPRFERVMVFIFGAALIVDSAESAEKLIYDRDVNVRCITFQGDKYSPSGTFDGGFSKQAPVLQQLDMLQDLERTHREKQNVYHQGKGRLAEMQAHAKSLQKITHRLKVLEHEVSLVKKRLDQTQYAQLGGRITELEGELTDTESHAEQSRNTRKGCEEKCVRLKNSIENFEKERERHTIQLEADIKKTKKQLTQIAKKLKGIQHAAEKIEFEQKDIEEELKDLLEQKEATEKQVESLKVQVEEKEKETKLAEEVLKETAEVLEHFQNKISGYNQALKNLERDLKTQEDEKREKQALVQKMELDIQHADKKKENAERTIKNMLESHGWIEEEKRRFGKQGSGYDFTAMNPRKAAQRLMDLRAEQKELDKKINKKSAVMYDKNEKDYNDLINKRKTVSKDKRKIEEVIKKLDDKKNELIDSAWQKVNKDFDEIFSTLLAGTNTRLRPPEGMTALDGLEVNVAFSGVWKETLSELSGGQRSLLALSLILALLRFNPAPMYILDEIDAALDPLHTQKIGRILKRHFARSQFIIVSLKDGMFSSANVLFNTKFVDGVSTVTRHTPIGRV